MEVSRSGFQTPFTVKEVVEKIHRKQYLLPAIQREFVWEPDQVLRLFDSLMRGYPISSFLFWDVGKEKTKEFQFYEFVTHYHERDSRRNPKANVTGENEVRCVLDGQQRLTALYIGLKGSYSWKIPKKRWENPDAFPERKLYLNLLSPAKNGQEMLYDFQFLTKGEASQREDWTYWFEVGKILEFSSLKDIYKWLRDDCLIEQEFPEQCMVGLYEMVNEKGYIPYYLETAQDLDKVLNIFIRVNSGGTPLSYSDLLLSIATAKWETKDAREEITKFVDELNRIGDGFIFDKDFVLKNCLVLSDITDIAFKVDNFNIDNMKTIEDKWDDITKAIRLAAEQASSFGYSRYTLTSKNALIPVAYYILKQGNPTGFVQSSKFREDRDKIGKWLTSSLIKRSFSGQPDNVLRPIRELVRSSSDGFPVDDIVTRFRGTTKSIEFTDADIENLLSLEYGEDHTFSVLSLLYPSFDFRRKFHEDHIFPRSSFRKPDLKKKSITQDKWEEYQANCDRLANLQLMEGIPNEEKHAQDFKTWLEKTYKDDSNRRDYLRTNLIPGGIDLDFGNFLEFVKEREKAIKARLREVLFLSKPQTEETT